MKNEKYDAIVVGAGLAGLSCAYELTSNGKKVLMLEKNGYPGGRTASFMDDDMQVESGLHRYIGYYTHLPKLLKECGVRIGDIVTWEEKADVMVKGENKKMVLGLAPVFGPIKAVRTITQNRDFLTGKDKLSMIPFFVSGFTSYAFSDKLDQFSVAEYANKHNVSENSKRLVLEPLSSGIFFMPPENYSAYAFFGLFAPAITRFYKMRIGAFLGGMSDVMCSPVADKIRLLGGEIHYNEPVDKVIVKNNEVIGVSTANGAEYYSKNVVVAAALNHAKTILSPLKNNENLNNFFALPTMSACSIQLELNSPALEKDITTFAPGTDMVSFAEQSRSTFRASKGRLSVILGNPKEYASKGTDEILKTVKTQMQQLGINLDDKIVNCKKVSEANAFYSLDKGNQHLRPSQKTGIKGLVLAGDYTKTPSFATMEGAVISGEKAAQLCL